MLLFSKELLESIASIAEVLAVVLTTLGAIAGVVFVLSSRPLRKIEAKEKLSLQAQVASATLGIAEAQKETARLNKLAEDERIARVRLEASVAPRRLSGKQREVLREVLRHDAPNNIAIVSALLDAESADFADDLASVFRSAGWDVGRITNHVTNEYGVALATLVGTAGDMGPVEKALNSVGIGYKVTTLKSDDHTMSPYPQRGVLYLLVGRKPNRVLPQ